VVHPDVGRINITYQAKFGDVLNYSVQLDKVSGMTLPYKFRVTESNDEHFIITRIDYLPQETLVLKAEVLEWKRNVKEVSGKVPGTTKAG
ncbi:MAG: hypothetical protein QXF14_02065, partial [Candidatus Woesearchaeota archaeon]